MISVIIPLYNKEYQIKSTLESVFTQTFQDFEIIIVNDGSTDSSVEVLKPFLSDRVRLIHQENQGVSAARNRGIAEAKYDYVALLDSDDEWDADCLETIVDLIRHFSGCSVYACAYKLRKPNGEIKPLVLNKLNFKTPSGVLDNYFEVASSSHPPLCSSSVVVKKKSILGIGGFPVGVKAGEDLLTWARLAVNNQIAYCTVPKISFIQSDSQNYAAAPARKPAKDDYVGRQLAYLYETHKSIIGLKQYVALWHKMRASMFLLLDQKNDSFKESMKSLKYNPTNYRVWSYLFLLMFPKSFRYKVFRKFGNQ